MFELAPIFIKCLKVSKTILKNSFAQSQHFSFLVKRNKILSIGLNQKFKTHPVAKKYDCRFDSIHAELACILNFPLPPSFLHNCTMVNIRLTKKKELALSKPCRSCAKMLEDFGISTIYYSTEKGFLRC